MTKLLLSFLACSLLTLMVSAQDETKTLPPGVPEDFVVTPFGYFHPSCVKQVVTGDIIRDDDMLIQHADGSADGMPVCSYAHYSGDGEAIPADARDPVIKHSWIVDVFGETASSYGAVTAKWKVPPAPSVKAGQTVYFFPGLQDYKKTATVTILQPVLGWNAYYKNEWGIASWNCCVKGTVYVSAPVPAKTGDTIYGAVVNNCKAGTLECTSWDVETADETSKKGTLLSKTSNFKQTFNWVFGGVLEVYSISKCSDYPTKPITFDDVTVYNDKFVSIDPKWYLQIYIKVKPQCGYGAHGSESAITLTY